MSLEYRRASEEYETLAQGDHAVYESKHEETERQLPETPELYERMLSAATDEWTQAYAENPVGDEYYSANALLNEVKTRMFESGGMRFITAKTEEYKAFEKKIRALMEAEENTPEQP